LSYEDVGRFNVTMDNSLRMGRVQRIGYLNDKSKVCSILRGLIPIRCFRV